MGMISSNPVMQNQAGVIVSGTSVNVTGAPASQVGS